MIVMGILFNDSNQHILMQIQWPKCNLLPDFSSELLTSIDRFCNCALFLITLILLLPMTTAYGQNEAEVVDSPNLTVELAFATNRKHNNNSDLANRFDDKIGNLSFGICSVQFTSIKLLKSAARQIPIWIPTEKEDIVALQHMKADEFWSEVRQRVDLNDRKVAFFIHGYKMNFDTSCRRAALLQRQLGPDVFVLLFAWPSQNNFALYTRDETLLKKSEQHIKTVLKRVLLSFGHGRTDVVGHSLGTRGITSAIAEMEQRNHFLFDELVLIAPDIDRHDFEKILPQLSLAASGITMYASENDGPLLVSQKVHGEPRIGEAGEHLALFDGVETVDISNVPRRDIYRHNYVYFNRRVIDDLRQLLTQGTRATKRSGLKKQVWEGKPFWKMLTLP